ncbi:MAG: murein biosynthesis integral membrane protein MurJ [Clostridiales bacterium]|nr:murein biosynthesis integral membrane protein MurJ [Clostridiales bacterium]
MDKKKDTGSRKKSMLIATVLMMLGLLLSKGSGFVRDIIVGIKFDEVYRDSYTLAFTIPDLFYNLLVGGAIFSSVAPYMSGSLAVNEEKRGVRTVSIFVSVISVVMLVVCTVGVIFSEQIYSVYNLFLAEGDKINPETLSLAANASKFLFPQIFFIMLAALSSGILNAYKRFSSTAFAPTVYNICVLLAIMIFAGNTQSELMHTTAGVLVSAFIYFMFLYILGFDILKKFRFKFMPRDKEFLFLLRRALPIMFSASIVQLNVVILNMFTGRFGNIIFLFRNANTIWQIPYGVFAVGIGTVMTPHLAGLYESRKYEECRDLLTSSIKNILFLTIPSAGMIFIMSQNVVAAIYQWGSRYTDENVATAAVLLRYLVLPIITQSIVHVMNHAFYAIGKTKVPLLAGVVGLVTNPLVCWLMIRLDFGLKSLSIAYSVTSIVQMVILIILYTRNKEIKPRNIGIFILKSAICLLFMGVVLVLIETYLPSGFTKLTHVLHLGLRCIVCVCVYFGMAIILKMEEARFWLDRFLVKLKLKKKTQG